MAHCQFIPIGADGAMLRIPGMPGHGLSVSQVNLHLAMMRLGLLPEVFCVQRQRQDSVALCSLQMWIGMMGQEDVYCMVL